MQRFIAKKAFSCEANALQALVYFEKKCEFIRLESRLAEAVSLHKSSGRPKTNRTPKNANYHVDGQVYTFLKCAIYAKRKVGTFILTTNEMNNKKLDMKALLAH